MITVMYRNEPKAELYLHPGSSVGRAPDFQGGGRGFDPRPLGKWIFWTDST